MVLFACLSLGSYAQSWCPPGAEWHHSFSVPGGQGEQWWWHAGDTIIGNDPAQIISRSFVNNGLSDTSYSHAAMITKDHEGLVEIWSNSFQAWDTLFWFNASVGDRWQRPHDTCYATYYYFEVISIDTLWLEGVPLRKLDLLHHYWLTTFHSLIERIGVCTYFTMPGPCIYENTINELLDYMDGDLTNVTETDLSCSFTTQISDIPSWSLNVHPNPGTDHFFLQLPPGQHDLVIFDPRGRLVLQQKVPGDRQVIDTSKLQSGMYHAVVTDRFGNRGSHRWVKQ